MQIGQLNKQLTLYTVSTTTMASGQKKEVFTSEITLFCSVVHTASETTQANQKVGIVNTTFIIHNVVTNPDVRRRLVYNGKTYEIQSIIPIENDFFQQITAFTRDNNNPAV